MMNALFWVELVFIPVLLCGGLVFKRYADTGRWPWTRR